MKTIYFAKVIKEKNGYSAMIPDISNFFIDAKSLEELSECAQNLLQLYLDDAMADGDKIPQPTSFEKLSNEFKKGLFIAIEGFKPEKVVRINLSASSSDLERITY